MTWGLIMAALKYRVILSDEERTGLEQRIRRGHDSARVLTRARILLKADAGKSEAEIADALEVSVVMVEQVRRRFCEGRLQRALFDKARPGAQRKLDGRQEAHLIAIACSEPPNGREHWTLKLLADEVVKLEFAESIAPETVRQILKKATSSPGKKSSGASLR
jgi:transposase